MRARKTRALTVDTLHLVSSAISFVQTSAACEEGAGLQALVQHDKQNHTGGKQTAAQVAAAIACDGGHLQSYPSCVVLERQD